MSHKEVSEWLNHGFHIGLLLFGHPKALLKASKIAGWAKILAVVLFLAGIALTVPDIMNGVE